MDCTRLSTYFCHLSQRYPDHIKAQVVSADHDRSPHIVKPDQAQADSAAAMLTIKPGKIAPYCVEELIS